MLHVYSCSDASSVPLFVRQSLRSPEPKHTKSLGHCGLTPGSIFSSLPHGVASRRRACLSAALSDSSVLANQGCSPSLGFALGFRLHGSSHPNASGAYSRSTSVPEHIVLNGRRSSGSNRCNSDLPPMTSSLTLLWRMAMPIVFSPAHLVLLMRLPRTCSSS
jgi:hypothetical protein